MDRQPAMESASVKHHRAWDESPLTGKLCLLILATLLIGVLIGLTEARYGEQAWPLALGLCAASWVLLTFVRCWIVTPYERLAHGLEVQARSATPSALKNLPVNRCDEIGRIARSMHQISVVAIRSRYESRRLRRVLDTRVKAETSKFYGPHLNKTIRNGLTKLNNRQFLGRHLDAIITDSAMSGADMICIMIGIDTIKNTTDPPEHVESDKMLNLLDTLLRKRIRQQDIAVRLDGDEFVVFMPESSIHQAAEFSQSIRQIFLRRSRVAREIAGADIRLSIGMASMMRDNCNNGPALLSRADHCLCVAKRAKNMIASPIKLAG